VLFTFKIQNWMLLLLLLLIYIRLFPHFHWRFSFACDYTRLANSSWHSASWKGNMRISAAKHGFYTTNSTEGIQSPFYRKVEVYICIAQHLSGFRKFTVLFALCRTSAIPGEHLLWCSIGCFRWQKDLLLL
jgi:hypothetical protein